MSDTAADREVLLLGSAMASDRSASLLRLLSPQELTVPIHRDIARAIGHLHGQGQPHGAHAVTEHLRRLDPTALAPQGPHGHLAPGDRANPTRAIRGLESWERNALPSQSAPVLVAEVRAGYRHREMQSLVNGITASNADPTQGFNSAKILGEVQAGFADLDRRAPELDPAKASTASYAQGRTYGERQRAGLGLPQAPVLRTRVTA